MNLRRNSCGANYWLVRFETQPHAPLALFLHDYVIYHLRSAGAEDYLQQGYHSNIGSIIAFRTCQWFAYLLQLWPDGFLVAKSIGPRETRDQGAGPFQWKAGWHAYKLKDAQIELDGIVPLPVAFSSDLTHTHTHACMHACVRARVCVCVCVCVCYCVLMLLACMKCILPTISIFTLNWLLLLVSVQWIVVSLLSC